MQASPSCHRLATSTLLDSCQSIDGSKHDSEVSHDYMRSIYAAQLAVCEIQSAESKVPPSCETLIPTGKADLFPKLGSQSVPRAHLSHCLQALETRPQWWTSYSNSRQNAVVICQAARADIEKGERQVKFVRSVGADTPLDELIKLHKSSVQINQDADAALAQAVEYSEEALRQKHEEFALAKRTLQDQLIQEIKIASGTAQSLLGKVMIGLNASVQTILMRLTSATRSVETDVANLRQVKQSRFTFGMRPALTLTCNRISTLQAPSLKISKRTLGKSFKRLQRGHQSSLLSKRAILMKVTSLL